MISTLLIERDQNESDILEKIITESCPQLTICNKTNIFKNAYNDIENLNPDLVFLEVDEPNQKGLGILNFYSPTSFEVIVTSTTEQYALQALNYSVSGYLLKPINKNKLIKSVNYACRRIKERKGKFQNRFVNNRKKNSSSIDEIIGIPTIEGYEFIATNDIIRCEGMQKCTRVITVEKTDIISSYNLGVFKNILEDYGFYMSHKSHLINLNKIRKYNKEGSILMSNGSWVPVSKRRKKDFLNNIQHI